MDSTPTTVALSQPTNHTYRAHRTGADIGPIIECTVYRRRNGHLVDVTERWVLNTVIIADGTWIPFGVRLRGDGSVDRRHISPGGGMTIKSLPCTPRRQRATGEYHRPDVTWGRV